MMTRRHSMMAAGAVLATLSFSAWSQSTNALNLGKDGVAIKGYDPVAYFTLNRALKGSPSFMAKHDGATYWFADAESQRAFLAQPDKYVPQYGGFCAFGVAKGAKPEIDPLAFSVVEGKLYLNKNPEIQSRWLKDVPGMIKSADENWKVLATKAP